MTIVGSKEMNKMKQIKFCLGVSVACLALGLSGCISLPNSPSSPTSRFYMLSAVNETQASKKINITPGVIIGVGPVKLPEYLDRPQMVITEKQGILKFDEFDRWGESLDKGIARLMRENLTVMLPNAKLTLYPWNPSMAVKYQVVTEVVQLDSELDKDMIFVVQWTVIDAQSSKAVVIKRSEFRQPILPQNYSGLVKVLSASCASLSSQIAEALAGLK
jgi:uncharacterized lipoprotein YmbA